MSAIAPDGRPLVGRVVRLDPTVPDDDTALFAALDDERVWAAGYGGGPAGRPGDAAGMRVTTAAAVRDRELGAGHPSYRMAYTVRLVADSELGTAGTVVGTTSVGDIWLADEKAHLGWTGYGPRWWATDVNPECKLLLLGHAFDDCGLGRVKLQTDLINTRSQAAIAKLGATREGVLRRHKARADGTFRDTVVFSILREDWPDVREGLLARLG
ncbi:GNAT family N-acetyltransferase [Angustibacter sp. McL0619]|uniref:GNAT family N-acetyltransferase n=1 Tax=Angustibacter sp. McL0619 TaxID=3415676 RepID=UPI003CEC71A0